MSKTTSKKPNRPNVRKTKASIVEKLLERDGGASLEAIAKATSWQGHSCRALLTGLRKKGREVVRYQDERGTSLYRMTPLDAVKDVA